jgi:aryl-phospho-beta-D-glucosidase BglC (GH1 family)
MMAQTNWYGSACLKGRELGTLWDPHLPMNLTADLSKQLYSHYRGVGSSLVRQSIRASEVSPLTNGASYSSHSESWLTPALFQNLPSGTVDEWTFCTNQNRNAATAALQNHWNTFITQDDFYQIAAAGLNHVRLPIGAWKSHLVTRSSMY